MKKYYLSYVLLALVLINCKNYDDEFADLRQQISALQTKTSSLESKTSSLESKIQSDISSVRSLIQTLQSQLPLVETKVDNLESDLSDLEGDISDLNDKLDQTITSLDQASTKLDETTDNLEETNTKLDKATNDLEDTNTKLDETTNDLEETNTKLDETSGKVDQASTKLDNTESKLTDATSSIDSNESKLEELEEKLDNIQTKLDGSLTQDDLKTLQEAINAVRSDLEAQLSESNIFFGGSIIITQNNLQSVLDEQSNVKQIGGDLDISADNMSSSQLSSIATWLAKVETVTGNLEVNHLNDSSPLIFSALRSVGNLVANQREAHYPELRNARNIRFHDDTERVDLSSLESANFRDDTIHLREGVLLDLSSLESYTPNEITIRLQGTNPQLKIGSLSRIGSGSDKGSLTIEGPPSVTLIIGDLNTLELTDVEILTARNLKGTSITVNEDVDELIVGVNVTGDAIKEINLINADDLERLTLKGTYDTSSGPGTDIILPPSIEEISLENIHSVISRFDADHEDAETYAFDEAKDRLDTVVLRGKIHEVELENIAVEGELELDHTSPDGVLRVNANAEITKITSPDLDELKVLEIQGNPKLEQIDFSSLGNAATNSVVTIGGAGTDEANNLIAEEITVELDEDEQGTGPARDGSIIEDSSIPAGIVALKDFLIDASSVSVYYDEVEEYQPGRSSSVIEQNVSIGDTGAASKLVVKETTNSQSDNSDRTGWL